MGGLALSYAAGLGFYVSGFARHRNGDCGRTLNIKGSAARIGDILTWLARESGLEGCCYAYAFCLRALLPVGIRP